MLYRIVLGVCFNLFFIVSAQQMNRGKSNIQKNAFTVIDSLTANKYAGRGFQEHGMDKAAHFLARAFSDIGMEKWDNDYFQEFNVSAMVPLKAKLTINGEKKSFGYDYVINPDATSFSIAPKNINILGFNDYLQGSWRNFYASGHSELVQLLPPKSNNKNSDAFNKMLESYKSHRFVKGQNPNDVLIVSASKLTHSIATNPTRRKIISLSDALFNTLTFTDSLSIDYESTYIERFKAKNVIGKIQGKTDSTIYITAHYDHLGKVGDTYFRGANDNASGVAMLLSLASYFKQNQPYYSMVFIAFAAEESGLLGSVHFTENVNLEEQKIKFLINLDILGTGEEGIQVVNSKNFSKEYNKLKAINEKGNYLPQIRRRGAACNSDHCPFYLKGVPSFFIYTLGGAKHYHDPLDENTALTLYAFSNLRTLFIEFINSLSV